MIISKMYDQLALRLEDVSNQTFTTADKRVAINAAQRQCVSILDLSYIRNLEKRKTNIPLYINESIDDTQELSLSENSIYPFAAKITLIEAPVRTQSEGIKGICRIVPPEFIEQQKNSYIDSTENEILACQYGDKILILSGSYVPPVAHISYIQDPALATNYTDTTNEIALNQTLHNVVLDLAEAELWARDKRHNRAMQASKKAHTFLTILNARKEEDYEDSI